MGRGKFKGKPTGRRQFSTPEEMRSKDELIWTWDPDGKFATKQVFKSVDVNAVRDNPVLGSVWTNNVRPKVEFFAWLVLQNAVTTKCFLFKRGLLQQSEIQCTACEEHQENCDHLFMQCRASWRTWSNAINCWGINWVTPENIQTCHQWWWNTKFKGNEKILWRITLYAVLWSIWLRRNDRIFNNNLIDQNEAWMLIKIRIARWAIAKWILEPYTINDFIHNFEGMRMIIKSKSTSTWNQILDAG